MWDRSIKFLTWVLFRGLACFFPAKAAPLPESAKLILVFSTTGIGDGLYDSPAMESLKRGHPRAKLIVCAHRKRRWMALHNPYVDEVAPYGKSPFFQWKLLGGFWRERPDIVMILHANEEVWPLAYLISRTSVVAVRGRCPKYEFLAGHQVEIDHHAHRLVSVLKVAAYAGGSQTQPKIVYEVDPAEIQALRARRHPWIDDSCVVFQTGGGKTLSWRDWPVESYVEVIRWMQTRYPHRIVLTGGGDNLERAAAIEEQCPGVINLAGKTALAETAALLKLAKMLFSTDTGVMHLGFAVCERVLCLLHWRTPAAEIGPLGGAGRHVALEIERPNPLSVPAAGDMKGISTERVKREIEKMLGEAYPPPADP